MPVEGIFLDTVRRKEHASNNFMPIADLFPGLFADVLINNTGSITQSIRAAHAARQEAQSLLERAKRAVEIAIEEGEAAGLALLK